MKYYKRFNIGFEHVGDKAYKVSPVWELGVHRFSTSDSNILRICFMRTKSRTYYWEIGHNKFRRITECR